MSLKKIPRWLLAVVSPPHRLPRLSIAFRLSIMCKDFLSIMSKVLLFHVRAHVSKRSLLVVTRSRSVWKPMLSKCIQ
ncbi:hypothetical protein K438DRAFT_1992710 [Mycena galopus ATCC 62051]|nr:hypothetical protein K438DRAFT_1992710 [Mycena galopus ATCC 62051]